MQWEAAVDPQSGRTYWYNGELRTSTWQNPQTAVAETGDSQPPQRVARPHRHAQPWPRKAAPHTEAAGLVDRKADLDRGKSQAPKPVRRLNERLGQDVAGADEHDAGVVRDAVELGAQVRVHEARAVRDRLGIEHGGDEQLVAKEELQAKGFRSWVVRKDEPTTLHCPCSRPKAL